MLSTLRPILTFSHFSRRTVASLFGALLKRPNSSGEYSMSSPCANGTNGRNALFSTKKWFFLVLIASWFSSSFLLVHSVTINSTFCFEDRFPFRTWSRWPNNLSNLHSNGFFPAVRHDEIHTIPSLDGLFKMEQQQSTFVACHALYGIADTCRCHSVRALPCPSSPCQWQQSATTAAEVRIKTTRTDIFWKQQWSQCGIRATDRGFPDQRGKQPRGPWEGVVAAVLEPGHVHVQHQICGRAAEVEQADCGQSKAKYRFLIKILSFAECACGIHKMPADGGQSRSFGSIGGKGTQISSPAGNDQRIVRWLKMFWNSANFSFWCSPRKYFLSVLFYQHVGDLPHFCCVFLTTFAYPQSIKHKEYFRTTPIC